MKDYFNDCEKRLSVFVEFVKVTCTVFYPAIESKEVNWIDYGRN